MRSIPLKRLKFVSHPTNLIALFHPSSVTDESGSLSIRNADTDEKALTLRGGIKRMKLLRMFILSSLALQLESKDIKLATDASFVCPPMRYIRPCVCTTIYDIPTVQCNRIRSLKAIKRALGAKFRVQTIPKLEIVGARFIGLPARAFANVSMTRLHIQDSHLKYVMDDAFLGLENLISLVLQKVRLFTLPAQSLNRLSSLVTLKLPSNNLFEVGIGDLKNATGLKHLSLVNNKLFRLRRGSFPISLVTLALSGNRIISLNKSVRHMVHLEGLYLNGNLIREIEGEFNNLYMLRHLKLGRNNLRSLGTALRNSRNLEILELQYNAIMELGNSLRRFRLLKTLDLSGNLLLQLGRTDFEGLTSLECLYLYSNRLIASNGALGQLPSLRSLDLHRNYFRNFSLGEISSSYRMEVLVLNENEITRVTSQNPYLSIRSHQILLARNKLTSLSDFMGHFPSLQEIDVSFNDIHFLRKADFAISSRLDYINIQGNPLICDAEQLAVYQELRSMNIEVDGRPNCTSDPPHL